MSDKESDKDKTVQHFLESAKALQGLGEGYMETGKNELALKYLKESLAINPDNPFVSRLIKQLDK